MSNLLHVTHITNKGRFHDIVFDLNQIRVYSIMTQGNYESNLPDHRIIAWTLIGSNEENNTCVSDSYESLIERIFKEKKDVS